MPPVYPLNVQGLAYSYRDIKPTGLPGMERIKTYLRGISFTNAVESDHAHGATQKAFGLPLLSVPSWIISRPPPKVCSSGLLFPVCWSMRTERPSRRASR